MEGGGVGIEVSYLPFDNKLHNGIKLAKRIRRSFTEYFNEITVNKCSLISSLRNGL